MVDFPGFNWHIAKRAKVEPNSRFLLLAAQTLGVGQLAVEKTETHCRPRAVQTFRSSRSGMRSVG